MTDQIVIDLFAGPGGWSEGMAPLGVAERGIDLDGDACDTARAAGHHRAQGNVAATEPRNVVDSWGMPAGIVASPPCQGFSTAGKGRGRRDSLLLLDELTRVDNRAELEAMITRLDRRMVDDRSLLAVEPLRWALALGPRWLAWEQVPAVLPLWQACAGILRGVGYSTDVGVLRAEQYGVPQTRRRAFLVARRDDATAAHGPAILPAPTHSRYHERDPQQVDEGMPRWVSMAEALGWSPEDRAGFLRRDDGNETVTLGGVDYRARDLRTADRPAFGLTEKVRSWTHIRMGNHVGSTVRPVDRPAPSVHFGPRANAVTWHDGEPPTRAELVAEGRRSADWSTGERVTVEEAATLQTFRAGYPWHGSQTSQYRQVGNAVPPLLARAVVEAVMVP